MNERDDELREVSEDEINEILAKHKKWVDSNGRDGNRADLSRVLLSDSRLLGAYLPLAILVRARLDGANLKEANLSEANLEGSDLRDANLNGANLLGASLNGADLRRVVGYESDANFVQNTKFDYFAKDKWSVLRQKYSGPMFFFHLILLLMFVTPYIAKTAFWYTVAQAEVVVQEYVAGIDSTFVSFTDTLPENERAVAIAMTKKLRERSNKLVPKEENGWRKYHLYQVLVGYDLSIWYSAASLMIILYNIGRGYLTRQVGAIRDEEERSKFSPAKKDYEGLFKMHRVMQFLMYISFASFLIHLYGWLSTEVLLPPLG